MRAYKARRYPVVYQYLICLALILVTSICCYFLVGLIGYKVVALILLLMVSISAMLFEILPVLLTAVLSALIWNFLFIPPTLTWHIGTPEDMLMFLMYFVIALINAVLTFKIREYEQKARDREEREKTIKLYDSILNSLSHELRTPIATIIGSIDTIKNNTFKISETNRNELYHEIEVAGYRLNRQVENLLNMSRLQAGVLQPKLDWCDVNELMHSVINMNSDDAQRHKVIFEANEKLPLFKFDSGLVEQILHNILHNALQHTPAHTIITMEATPYQKGCRFVIADNGPGFPEGEIALVFDKFYRLQQSATGGTGLGLSIAKAFAQAHKGDIYLKNIPTGGAMFTIDIPAETSTFNEIEHE